MNYYDRSIFSMGSPSGTGRTPIYGNPNNSRKYFWDRQRIARKGVRAVDSPGLSTDECEHPFAWYFADLYRPVNLFVAMACGYP